MLEIQNYRIDLGFFAGPLDLLLHLVRRQEVAIEDVSMARVAEQYLEIIAKSIDRADIDLELVSEYLVVAATLISLKSESLLPSEAEGLEQEEEHSEEFYAELRERLRRYAVVKQQAEALRARPQLGVNTFHRVDRQIQAPDPEKLVIDDDAHSLSSLFVNLLKRIGESGRAFRVRLEPVSVVQYMMRLIGGLQDKTRENFPNTFLGFAKRFCGEDKKSNKDFDSSRPVLVGSFIAMLELVKRGVLTATPLACGDIDLNLCISDDVSEHDFEDETFDDIPELLEVNSG